MAERGEVTDPGPWGWWWRCLGQDRCLAPGMAPSHLGCCFCADPGRTQTREDKPRLPSEPPLHNLCRRIPRMEHGPLKRTPDPRGGLPLDTWAGEVTMCAAVSFTPRKQ